jgi:hypothetical protein
MSRDRSSPARKSNTVAQAPFHVVLDQLGGGGREPGAAIFRPHAAPVFDSTYAAQEAAPAAVEADLAGLYADVDIDDSRMATGESSRSIEEAVAQELGLSDGLAPAELERIRRQFAYRHHPDRVVTARKAEALERMTVANVLIDQALKAARARVVAQR